MNPTEMTLEKRIAIAAAIFVATGLLAILFRFAPLLIGAPLFAGWFWAATGSKMIASEEDGSNEFIDGTEEGNDTFFHHEVLSHHGSIGPYGGTGPVAEFEWEHYNQENLK